MEGLRGEGSHIVQYTHQTSSFSECMSYSQTSMHIRQMTLILIHPQVPTALYSSLRIEIDQLRPKAAIDLIHQMCPVRKSLLVSLQSLLQRLLFSCHSKRVNSSSMQRPMVRMGGFVRSRTQSSHVMFKFIPTVRKSNVVL